MTNNDDHHVDELYYRAQQQRTTELVQQHTKQAITKPNNCKDRHVVKKSYRLYHPCVPAHFHYLPNRRKPTSSKLR